MSKVKRLMMPGIAVLAALVAIGLAGTASAFHDGGVAHCDGCHSMHNSPDNPIDNDAVENALLLKGSTPSSTCLNCHAGAGSPTSYHSKSDDGSVWSPGGDFFWVATSYDYTSRSGPVTSDPDNNGHNVIAPDHGIVQDATNTTAPGGVYPSANLHCTSCHDPHGQVNGGTKNNELPVVVSGSYGEEPPDPLTGQAGNYRLLGDTFYGLTTTPTAAILGGSGTPKYGETDSYKVAYGQDMSEWCGACHPDYVNSSTKHPAGNGQSLEGAFGSLSANYNSYVKTGDFSGSQATAYLQFVPFERGTTDKAALLIESTNTNGPNTGEANVMCLSCHRAHASAFTNATRWDAEAALLAESRPDATSLSGMGAVPNAAYYGRDIAGEFGEFQRAFCNKCHVKD